MGEAERLTLTERETLDQLAKCWTLLQACVGDGPTRQADLAELVAHIHALQTAVMGQAAARSYPGVYRLLGGTRATQGGE